MSDSVLVRFPDKLAAEMRERAQSQGKTMTAFINDAVKAYVERLAAEDAEGAPELKARRMRRLLHLAVRIADMRELIAEASEDEGAQSALVRALSAVADCIELMPVEVEENIDPVTWQQFRYSKLNESKGDDEAYRMFASDYEEIEARPWTWYLNTSSSDGEAKIRWLRQRRRYGLPLPPDLQR